MVSGAVVKGGRTLGGGVSKLLGDARQGYKAAGSTTSSWLKNAGTLGTLGLSYTGYEALSTYEDVQKSQDQAEIANAYEQAMQDVESNENLAPEEKADARDQIHEQFMQMLGRNPDGGSGGSDGGIVGTLFGGGMMGTVMMLMLVMAILKFGSRVLIARA